MTKVPITITIDLEVAEKLKKERNSSSVINELLWDRYNLITNFGKCRHDWSEWFGCANGLAKECKICHTVEYHPKYDKMKNDKSKQK